MAESGVFLARVKSAAVISTMLSDSSFELGLEGTVPLSIGAAESMIAAASGVSDSGRLYSRLRFIG